MRANLLLLTIGLLLSASACASDVDEPAAADGMLERRLAGAGEAFAFGPEDGHVSFAARARDASGGDLRDYPIEVGLLDGQVNARHDAAGNLVIDVIDVRLDDIRISPEALPPFGLELTEVHVTLAEPVVEGAQWTADGRSVTANVQGDLLIDWSFRNSEYDHLPLAQQTVRGISLTVTIVEAADGELQLTLEGAASGEFLAWSEVVKLSDLSFTMSGGASLR